MKKLLLLLLLVPAVSFGQKWSSVDVVDRYGDKTGKSFSSLIYGKQVNALNSPSWSETAPRVVPPIITFALGKFLLVNQKISPWMVIWEKMFMVKKRQNIPR